MCAFMYPIDNPFFPSGKLTVYYGKSPEGIWYNSFLVWKFHDTSESAQLTQYVTGTHEISVFAWIEEFCPIFCFFLEF